MFQTVAAVLIRLLQQNSKNAVFCQALPQIGVATNSCFQSLITIWVTTLIIEHNPLLNSCHTFISSSCEEIFVAMCVLSEGLQSIAVNSRDKGEAIRARVCPKRKSSRICLSKEEKSTRPITFKLYIFLICYPI